VIRVLGSAGEQGIIFQPYQRFLYTPKEILLTDRLNRKQKSRSAFMALAAFSLCWSQSGLLYWYDVVVER